MGMKKVKIEYIKFSEDNDCSVLSISHDYPSFYKKNLIYYSELDSLEFIKDKINNAYGSSFCKANHCQLGAFPYFININDKEYEQLKDYMLNDTDYKKTMWEADYAMLNLAICVSRQDPKFWEV